MKKIPDQLKKEGFSFAKLNGKNPNIGGADWQKQRHSWEEAEKWLNQGFNYGVMCGINDVIVIDGDISAVSEMVLENLPKTMTVLTGSGKMHSYFFCPDFGDKVIFNDEMAFLMASESEWEESRVKAEKKAIAKGLDPQKAREDAHPHCGEIIVKGFQAVGPGSIHPDTGQEYIVVLDEPIATVTREQIMSAMAFFIKSSTKSTVGLPIATSLEPTKKRGIDTLTIRDILPGVTRTSVIDHPIHGATNGGNLSLDLEKNVWHCFRCDSGGSPLHLFAVLEGIISCEEAKGGFLRGLDFMNVFDRAKEKFPFLEEKEEETQKKEEEDDEDVCLISEVMSRMPETPSFSTGYFQFDNVLSGGFHIGDLIGISGHPGQGKTFFAQSLTKRLIDNGVPCLWFSQEMNLREVWLRFLEIGADTDFLAYTPIKMTSDDIAWMERIIIKAKQKNPEIKAVFYDHLGFLSKKFTKMDAAMANSQQAYLNMVCRELKKMALNHNIVIFIIAHCRKTKGIPTLQDIADTSGVGRETDAVFIVNRQEVEEENGDVLLRDPISTLSLVKNRRTGQPLRVLAMKNNDPKDKALVVVSKIVADKVRNESGFNSRYVSVIEKRKMEQQARSDFKNIDK